MDIANRFSIAFQLRRFFPNIQLRLCEDNLNWFFLNFSTLLANSNTECTLLQHTVYRHIYSRILNVSLVDFTWSQLLFSLLVKNLNCLQNIYLYIYDDCVLYWFVNLYTLLARNTFLSLRTASLTKTVYAQQTRTGVHSNRVRIVIICKNLKVNLNFLKGRVRVLF